MRNDLGALLLQTGQHHFTPPMLKGAGNSLTSKAGDPNDSETVALLSAAEALRSTTLAVRYAQKAIFLAPWKREHWVVLAFSRGRVF
jgi:hypothetical protein